LAGTLECHGDRRDRRFGAEEKNDLPCFGAGSGGKDVWGLGNESGIVSSRSDPGLRSISRMDETTQSRRLNLLRGKQILNFTYGENAEKIEFTRLGNSKVQNHGPGFR